MLVLIPVLAGCAATPALPVPEGSRVVVRLYDAHQGVELALANESYPELTDLYSRARGDAGLKLAPDRLIGELLASLESAGLTRFGRSGTPETFHGERGYLFVDRDGNQHVFVQPAGGAPDEERLAYTHMKLLMDEYYRHVGGLQFVRNPEGHDIFRGNP